ncbi:MAG: hypothetical protein DRP99_06245 [Candidatus Latescibacterota bacterium]|nr:MAG: hypothetical protein DRP99_06245 [Candidatus Latescibacterota bacterium]
MMACGRGGVAGWGDLCGALNGACAAVNLVVEDFTSIIDELMAWYVREAIPTATEPEGGGGGHERVRLDPLPCFGRKVVQGLGLRGGFAPEAGTLRQAHGTGSGRGREAVERLSRREVRVRVSPSCIGFRMRPVPHRGRGGRERQGEDGLLPVPQEARDVKWNGERG